MLFKNFTNINANPVVGVKERLAFGCGDLASNIIYSAMSMFLLFYYTDVIGVSAGAVGTIMLVSRLLDGISDLIMGVIIDRTKSPYGKARPWILRMMIPYAIGAALLFSVPTSFGETAKLIYIFISYNLVFTIIFTAINLPYATLNALITQDQYERSVLNIFRMLLATVGTLFITTCTLPVVKFFGNDARAWTYTFILFGMISIVFFMITFLGTRERTGDVISNEPKKNVPIRVGFKALIKNKYWIIITLTLVLIYISAGINGAATIYFAKLVLGNQGYVSQLAMAMTISQIIAMFIVAKFVKKHGKRNVLIGGCVITVVAYIIIMIGGNNFKFVLIGNIIRGLGGAGMAASMFAMVSDTIEYGEWKSGIRTEGLINSASSFGQKVGNGLSAAIFGWILAIGGYAGGASTQTASAITAVKAAYIYIPLILTIVTIAILFGYKLDKEYPSILKELKSRNATNYI
ncbi:MULTISPECIES: MFS transporter [Clostridium]|uniref:MFS transporter n=1 Tax=Clostridium frigoriphilum TaxID=443253 RepID=A0ABU7UR57_9CLOT|nr:MFS transporter [Clostridium sp. DSM 17811]MBU3101802.1 MFS transporter [Clostridium sp. DSM 17811]